MSTSCSISEHNLCDPKPPSNASLSLKLSTGIWEKNLSHIVSECSPAAHSHRFSEVRWELQPRMTQFENRCNFDDQIVYTFTRHSGECIIVIGVIVLCQNNISIDVFSFTWKANERFWDCFENNTFNVASVKHVIMNYSTNMRAFYFHKFISTQ